MFCKWCGNTISPTDSSCPVCGRQTPPMADCGGYYNLNYSAPVEPAPAPVKAPCPVVEKLEGRYMKDRKTSRRHYKTSLVLLLVLLLLSAVTVGLLVYQTVSLGKVRESLELNGEVTETEPEATAGETESKQEETIPPTETEPEETVAETEPEETEVAEETEDPEETESENKTGAVVVDFEDNGANVGTDLAEYGVVLGVSWSNDQKQNTTEIAVELENESKVVILTVEQGAEMIELNPKIAEAVFGKGGEPEYEWEYMTRKNAGWKAAESATGSTISAEDILGNGAACEEVRCTITYTSKDGNQLIVIVEGLAFQDQEANEER